jgi:hypothetical protein
MAAAAAIGGLLLLAELTSLSVGLRELQGDPGSRRGSRRAATLTALL